MFKTLTISQKKTKELNSNWQEIPDQPYRILIVGGSGSGKQMHYWI